MPKIVEILAPSGTGKSTLYRLMQKKWKPDDGWVMYHDFRYKRKQRYRFPVDYVYALLRKMKLAKQSVFSKEIQYQNRSIYNTPNEKLFYSNHPEFCDLAMDIILKHNAFGFDGHDKRFMTIFFLLETIEHLQAVLNYPDDPRTCVMDEGLLSRLMHLNSPSFAEEDLMEYLEKMPLPDSVVYLKCDPQIITERIVYRKDRKVAIIHKNLTEKEIFNSTLKTQHLMEKTIEEVKKRGVRVIYADASRKGIELAEQVHKSVGRL